MWGALVLPHVVISGLMHPDGLHVLCAGVLRASVHWSALQHTPGVDRGLPGAEASQHAARSPAEVLRSFVDFCVHFTSTAPWEAHIPDSMHGAHALVMLQARHDKFVFFEDGKKLFDDLRRVASAPGRVASGALVGQPTKDRGVKAAAYVRGDKTGNNAPPLLHADELASDCAMDAELIEVPGGHVTGFLQCRWLLPQAVLSALARLQAKHGLPL